MSKLEIFDLFFNHQVKLMYSGIEATMEKKESLYTCALALSTYTEVMGGLVTGNLKEERKSKENYEAFLEYLGEKYVDLNNELQKYVILTNEGKKQPVTLYKIIRSKLVHEFALRNSHFIINSESISDDKIGIEISFFDNKIYHVNFYIKEYYRDFKNGVTKYYDKLKFEVNQPSFSHSQTLLGNFLKSVVENFHSE